LNVIHIADLGVASLLTFRRKDHIDIRQDCYLISKKGNRKPDSIKTNITYNVEEEMTEVIIGMVTSIVLLPAATCISRFLAKKNMKKARLANIDTMPKI
jgi:hypothetical protein